ncbi:hypothetical protein [Paenibacillus sp. PL2-23]
MRILLQMRMDSGKLEIAGNHVDEPNRLSYTWLSGHKREVQHV